MSKSLYSRILTGFLLICISMACRIPFTPIAQPETETPVPTANPTETDTPVPTASPKKTATLVPAATAFVAPDTATPKFAPFCQPSSASIATPVQCQVPIAEQSTKFCSSKVPYNLILINAGSTYETLNEDIKCSEAGIKEGKQLLTCTGPMAIPFELRVCDPSCAFPTFQEGTTHCPQDLNYNELLRCCEREPLPIDQNCVVLKLQTKSCVIDCSEYTNQTTCDKNAYACDWDRENNVCQLRR